MDKGVRNVSPAVRRRTTKGAVVQVLTVGVPSALFVRDMTAILLREAMSRRLAVRN